jgi:hypothetical protein
MLSKIMEGEMLSLLMAAGLAASDGLPMRVPCNAGMLHASADLALLMRPQDWRAARPRKLGQLPPARAEYAVMRTVRGCMVAAPVRFEARLK